MRKWNKNWNNDANALKHRERKLVIKKNVSEYFVNFTRHHRPWLQELAERYKEKCEFPMFPILLLPAYYEELKDKEVAAFAALLIKEDGDFSKVYAIKQMLGEKPWEWFEKREFVRLSIGRVQDMRTGGVLNWKIAKLMNRIWGECHNGISVKPIGENVEDIRWRQNCSLFDVLTYLVEDCCVGNYLYKLRLLQMVFCSDDGIGLSLWPNSNPYGNIPCPIATGMRQFVGTWFPDWRRVGSLDDAIRLFGFKRDCDFFYAWLGYKELQKRNPKECSMYATTYMRWYVKDTKIKPFKWRGILPIIPF